MASFRVLDYRVTLGVSVWALAANVLYFWLVRHSLRDALVLGASSLVTIGAMHIGHSVTPPQPLDALPPPVQPPRTVIKVTDLNRDYLLSRLDRIGDKREEG